MTGDEKPFDMAAAIDQMYAIRAADAHMDTPEFFASVVAEHDHEGECTFERPPRYSGLPIYPPWK